MLRESSNSVLLDDEAIRCSSTSARLLPVCVSHTFVWSSMHLYAHNRLLDSRCVRQLATLSLGLSLPPNYRQFKKPSGLPRCDGERPDDFFLFFCGEIENLCHWMRRSWRRWKIHILRPLAAAEIAVNDVSNQISHCSNRLYFQLIAFDHLVQ